MWGALVALTDLDKKFSHVPDCRAWHSKTWSWASVGRIDRGNYTSRALDVTLDEIQKVDRDTRIERACQPNCVNGSSRWTWFIDATPNPVFEKY